MTDFFKFETVKEDLPFYNGVPEIPAWSWIILLAGVIAHIMLIMHIPVELNYNIFPIALMLSTTLPILIVARGNYGYFFKKISMGDVKYIILTVILSFIYSIVFGAIFYMAEGVPQSMLQLMGYEISISYIIEIILPLFIQLMGEELFKVIMILIMMLILYKFSKNRKASLAVSVFVALVLFGLMHAGEYGSFLRVIVVQGIGSIFDVLLYLKTKNVFASYLSHLLFDIISLSIAGQLLI